MAASSVSRFGAGVRVVASLVLVIGSIGLDADPTRASPPLTITPGTGLTDFMPVRVTVGGFDEHARHYVYQCRAGAEEEVDCDPASSFPVDIQPDGTVDTEFYVDARIYLRGGEEVDCRTDPAGCVIGVGYSVEANDWPQARIAFDADAPLRPEVAATVTPDQSLTDGQTVTINGEHLSFREESSAYVCVDGPGEPWERCDIDRLVSGVPEPDGTVVLDLAVWPSFNTPVGETRTCGPRGDECVVLVNWGLFGAPDRQASVPISFAVAPPTTTTTVPPAQPQPAPAAAPVAAQANFTG